MIVSRIALYISISSCFGMIDALAPCDTSSTRRSAIKQAFSAGGASLVSASLLIPQISQALEACRPKARNCVRTTWMSPPSMSKVEAVERIRSVLNAYPQKGQNGVDCNGWSLVNDSFDNSNIAWLEYRSCVGPAALAINLGKPFIDDVKLEIEESQNGILIQIKSSSRMGSTDLYVNKKRIDYIRDQLRSKGWAVPDVKYGT